MSFHSRWGSSGHGLGLLAIMITPAQIAPLAHTPPFSEVPKRRMFHPLVRTPIELRLECLPKYTLRSFLHGGCILQGGNRLLNSAEIAQTFKQRHAVDHENTWATGLGSGSQKSQVQMAVALTEGSGLRFPFSVPDDNGVPLAFLGGQHAIALSLYSPDAVDLSACQFSQPFWFSDVSRSRRNDR